MSMNNAGIPGAIPMGVISNPMSMGMPMNREVHQVPFDMLPTKGVAYPDNIEILVSPMRIRERRQLEGATQATYYEKLLEGITIRGGMFDKRNLIFADVQMLDLVRRIHSFELDKEIQITGYTCEHCEEESKVSFKFTDIEFEDMAPEVFKTERKLIDPETQEEVTVTLPGKVYKFSDGTEVVAGPLTVGEYIDLATRYLSNVSEKNISTKMADIYIAQYSYLIKEVIGQKFLSDDFKRKYLNDYIGDLYKVVDEDLLTQIEKETTSILVPIKKPCEHCGEMMEVYVQPSLRFQQEV